MSCAFEILAAGGHEHDAEAGGVFPEPVQAQVGGPLGQGVDQGLGAPGRGEHGDGALGLAQPVAPGAEDVFQVAVDVAAVPGRARRDPPTGGDA